MRAALAHAIIFTAMCAFALSVENPACWLTVGAVSLLLVAREQRVLELLVHDASHRNWTRDRAKNDRVSLLVAGMPIASDVAAYWDSHRVHHHEYGSPRDPDWIRFFAAGRPDIGKTWAAARWMLRYAIGYYRTIGSSPKVLARFFLWHAVAYMAPLSLFFGLTDAAIAWCAVWLVSMLTSLPILRAIAELEEHNYSAGATEFETTYTNLGLWHTLLIHPWFDEYHLIHHLYPGIPQFRHPEAHRLLIENDPGYRKLRIRRKILGEPLAA